MTIEPDFVPFIAETIPAKVVQVSNSTLFRVAARQTEEALEWVAIAQLNGLIDPWITPLTPIKIPPVFPTATPTGLLLVTPGGATAGIPQT
jgi:hypothetical protein